MQTTQFVVQINQVRGDARQPAVALIRGVGDVDGISDGLEEGLKSALGRALFGQFVQGLFGLNDLFFRFVVHIDLFGLSRDVLANGDQFAPYCEIVDHLCVIACGKRRNCRPSEACKIGGAAEFFQPFVVFQKRLERHGRGEVVFGDARSGHIKDAGMNRIIEMTWPDDGCDAIKNIVVCQDRAQKLLFSLNRMGDGIDGGFKCARRVECRNLVHLFCPCMRNPPLCRHTKPALSVQTV